MSTQTQQSAPQSLTFSERAEAELQNILSKYPTKRAALIPTLYLAQREFDYLSVSAMEYVAERLDMPPSKVLQVATFYTMFKKKPGGRYHIEVCTSVPCCNMGGYSLLRHLETKLGIKAGETTPDKKFTVTEAECLAACGLAPLIQIDSLYYENLDTELLDKIIDELP